MKERGKYHRQRLKAREVLQLYAAGERDFRGAILQGCNFHGADLSRADFSGADIRSAQFMDALLHGTKFSNAVVGVKQPWVATQFFLVALIATTPALLQMGTSKNSLLIEKSNEMARVSAPGFSQLGN